VNIEKDALGNEKSDIPVIYARMSAAVHYASYISFRKSKTPTTKIHIFLVGVSL